MPFLTPNQQRQSTVMLCYSKSYCSSAMQWLDSSRVLFKRGCPRSPLTLVSKSHGPSCLHGGHIQKKSPPVLMRRCISKYSFCVNPVPHNRWIQWWHRSHESACCRLDTFLEHALQAPVMSTNAMLSVHHKTHNTDQVYFKLNYNHYYCCHWTTLTANKSDCNSPSKMCFISAMK